MYWEYGKYQGIHLNPNIPLSPYTFNPFIQF